MWFRIPGVYKKNGTISRKSSPSRFHLIFINKLVTGGFALGLVLSMKLHDTTSVKQSDRALWTNEWWFTHALPQHTICCKIPCTYIVTQLSARQWSKHGVLVDVLNATGHVYRRKNILIRNANGVESLNFRRKVYRLWTNKIVFSQLFSHIYVYICVGESGQHWFR